jgi:cation:H+ antiporter
MVWGEGLVPWAIFLLSAAVIVYAGTTLSRYGDEIAKLTGLGGLWIGVVVMAGATSLPEIFTTVSAGWLNTPDLAAGNLFGAG